MSAGDRWVIHMHERFDRGEDCSLLIDRPDDIDLDEALSWALDAARKLGMADGQGHLTVTVLP